MAIIESENFGDYIRRLRNEKGTSINELVIISGISKGYISQIENNKFSPSLDIVRKLSNALEIDFYELAHLAGHFDDNEMISILEQKATYENMSPEEVKKHEDDILKWNKKNWNIKQYQEKIHVRLEDFLEDNRRNFYIGDHKLTNEDIKMLITLYGGKEKNYPSNEQIEEEYEAIKRNHENNNSKEFFIIDDNYDIDTNEDI